MEITDKINYVLGKTVVYMLLIIYPFVMHNKLNDVTLTKVFLLLLLFHMLGFWFYVLFTAKFILKELAIRKNMMMTMLILLIFRKVRIVLKVRA